MIKLRYVLSFWCCFGLSLSSNAQNVVLKTEQKIDSTYKNWYYDSREDLYSKLERVKYDVVFFGNSITERGDWQELIGNKLAVANRGIGGDNTFGLKARLPGIIKLNPKKIFIMIGINDIGRSLPVGVILTNYRDILQTMKLHIPKTKIYVQSVLPLNDAILQADYLKNKAQYIEELNAGLQKLTKEFQLNYVDLRPLFSSDKNVLDASYTIDGIHLKPKAYVLWVNYLKEKKYL